MWYNDYHDIKGLDIIMKNYKFFQNIKCEYFPCHKLENEKEFNCLFCFCPLYMLGEDCQGNFKYLESGVKSCEDCILPHVKDKGYEHVIKKMKIIMETVKKK